MVNDDDDDDDDDDGGDEEQVDSNTKHQILSVYREKQVVEKETNIKQKNSKRVQSNVWINPPLQPLVVQGLLRNRTGRDALFIPE